MTAFDYLSLVGLPSHEAVRRIIAAGCDPERCKVDPTRIEFAYRGVRVICYEADGEIIEASEYGDA